MRSNPEVPHTPVNRDQLYKLAAASRAVFDLAIKSRGRELLPSAKALRAISDTDAKIDVELKANGADPEAREYLEGLADRHILQLDSREHINR